MRILSAELHDYMSFLDCPPINFGEGINFVLGVNNSGKSTLLRALNPNFLAQANRNEERFREFELPPPRVTIRLQTNGDRFQQATLQIGSCAIPVEPGQDAKVDGEDFFLRSKIDCLLIHRSGGVIESRYPGHCLFAAPTQNIAGLSLPRMAGHFLKEEGFLKYVGQSAEGQDTSPNLNT